MGQICPKSKLKASKFVQMVFSRLKNWKILAICQFQSLKIIVLAKFCPFLTQKVIEGAVNENVNSLFCDFTEPLAEGKALSSSQI